MVSISCTHNFFYIFTLLVLYFSYFTSFYILIGTLMQLSCFFLAISLLRSNSKSVFHQIIFIKSFLTIMWLLTNIVSSKVNFRHENLLQLLSLFLKEEITKPLLVDFALHFALPCTIILTGNFMQCNFFNRTIALASTA